MFFFSEGPSNYWTEGFLLKAFHGSCKMKVSTKCFVWGHSAKKSDGVFFSGSSSDSRIRRFLWKYFKKTWRHLKKPQNLYHVILNVLFIWLKVLHCQHEWTNEWIFPTHLHLYPWNKNIIYWTYYIYYKLSN